MNTIKRWKFGSLPGDWRDELGQGFSEDPKGEWVKYSDLPFQPREVARIEADGRVVVSKDATEKELRAAVVQLGKQVALEKGVAPAASLRDEVAAVLFKHFSLFGDEEDFNRAGSIADEILSGTLMSVQFEARQPRSSTEAALQDALKRAEKAEDAVKRLHDTVDSMDAKMRRDADYIERANAGCAEFSSRMRQAEIELAKTKKDLDEQGLECCKRGKVIDQLYAKEIADRQYIADTYVELGVAMPPKQGTPKLWEVARALVKQLEGARNEIAEARRVAGGFLAGPFEGNTLAQVIETISLRCATAEKQAKEWKANHDNQVAIKRAALDRPDLGDRAEGVRNLQNMCNTLRVRVIELEASRDAWKSASEMSDHKLHTALGQLSAQVEKTNDLQEKLEKNQTVVLPPSTMIVNLGIQNGGTVPMLLREDVVQAFASIGVKPTINPKDTK